MVIALLLCVISDELLADINKDTVDFQLNFDDSIKEPTVLPARLPNLLINGATGIAVGMATNMLPHNLTEVINGIAATIDNPDITIEELTKHITAPDFPTGGIIYGYKGVKEGFETGRGRVVVRGRAEIETSATGKERIIITEIPYQVNKAQMIVKMADLVNDKKITGISDIRDDTDRNGLRVVIEVTKDAMANVVLSHLYKWTPLQTSYGINNVALVNGRPRILTVKDMIREFVKFRLEVIVRRTQYDLRKAEERAHILEGLLIALDHLDEVIALIRASKTPEEAKNGLMEKFELSELQAKAILDMRLQKLTGLERDKIKEEYNELQKKIAWYKEILADETIRLGIIKDELAEIKEKYGDERRTEISYADGEISIEDMIADEEVVITISHLGYIKRTKVSEYRVQSRGGRGSRGSKTRDEDFVEHIFQASTHNYLLLFTEQGRCYWLRAYEIPEGSKVSSGRVIRNIVQMPADDKVKAYIIIKDLTDEEFINNHYIVFCTRQGLIKKTLVEAFSRPRTNGINAITINEGDNLIEARLTDGNSEVLIANRRGRAIRFPEEKVRAMGRSAAGVRGIRLEPSGDEVVGMICVDPNDPDVTVFVVSEKGMGKRSALEDYRVTNRGGKGVKTMNLTDKTGQVVAIKAVKEGHDLMIINRSGIIIRIPVDEKMRIMGRATQGVRVINLSNDDQIADVAVIDIDEDEENPVEGVVENSENGQNIENGEMNNDESQDDASDETNDEEIENGD